MFAEDFGSKLNLRTTWIEPYYKCLLSNKMLLVLLYEMFPDSPFLLPAYYGEPNALESWVRKPVYSREGNNVLVCVDDTVVQETGGEYGEEGYIYQAYFKLPSFDGYKPVIGSWLIDSEPAGIGIKETSAYIHEDMSVFCPHYIE